MSKIGITEVERLARLARIGLTPDEASSIAVELGAIVEYVEQLQAVDTTGVEETSQVTGLTSVLREDEIRPKNLSRDELLKNAPAKQNGYIKVKRVL